MKTDTGNCKKRVFVDMDGVLCEFRTESTMDDMLASGYFYGLSPRNDMLDALKCLIDSGEREVFVLSAVIPEIEAQAKQEKNKWLNEYLPAIDSAHRIFPLCGTDKTEAIDGFSATDILLDDYSVNLEKWNAAGGKAVKILNEVNGKNGTFRSGPRLRINKREDLVELVRMLA